MTNDRRQGSPWPAPGNDTISYKVRVAREALKGEETIAGPANRFEIHPGLIRKWKYSLAECAVDTCGRHGENAILSQH